MKKRYIILASLIVLGLFTVTLYRSGFELRIVPNRPHLRPAPSPQAPSPRELADDFRLSGGSERNNRGFPQRKIIDLVSMYPGLFFREGPERPKRVALTFDDGPDSVYTPQILDVLREHNVKATFFLIGNRVELFPEVTRRIAQEGHIIGNHTMSHPDIVKLGKARTRQEILRTEEALLPYTGYRTALFRSPYGSINPAKVEEVQALNYKIIAWNVDSLDWKSLTAEQVKTNILEYVRPGSIILQHSAGGREENLSGTVQALGDIIRILKRENYRFVTIPQLLDIPYAK